jgi:hypothetical protein
MAGLLAVGLLHGLARCVAVREHCAVRLPAVGLKLSFLTAAEGEARWLEAGLLGAVLVAPILRKCIEEPWDPA